MRGGFVHPRTEGLAESGQISRLSKGPAQQGPTQKPEGAARRPPRTVKMGPCLPASPSIALLASWGEELGLASVSHGGAPLDDVRGPEL